MSEVVSMQWTEAEIVGINQDRVSYILFLPWCASHRFVRANETMP